MTEPGGHGGVSAEAETVLAATTAARHTGHADLLRESVDGLVGEGAPADFLF